jgi:hypothetical protein
MVLTGTSTADKDFEELLSAAWAVQLAQLRTPPDPGDSAAKSRDSVKVQEAGK